MPSLSTSALLTAIFAMSLATFMTRVAPFLFLGSLRDNARLAFVGRYLPPAVMVILVFYCAKSVKIFSYPHGIPEAMGVSAVAGLHAWRRSTLLSIFGGTFLYLLLLRTF